jgi:Glycosyl hydrolase family 63 C-terminal domain
VPSTVVELGGSRRKLDAKRGGAVGQAPTRNPGTGLDVQSGTLNRAREQPKGTGRADDVDTAEERRLAEDASRALNWKRFGPYLAERQWGTVREDYSENGTSWEYFPHDHARSRAYRWGEDGLLGFCDREGRLCFAVALWNGQDPILKERLFGLTGNEGNHGEDVKEEYFYVDATPTHSYGKGLYKYPQRAFPYDALVKENARRGRLEREYELADTGAFDDSRYFDVTVEYAKASPDDVLVTITVANRGPEAAPLVVLPTLWFRNTWSWGRDGEGYWKGARLAAVGASTIVAEHSTLGAYRLTIEAGPDGVAPELLFTENETNAERLYGAKNTTPFVKDAFHAVIIEGRADAVNPARTGTKAAAAYRLTLAPGAEARLRLRLTAGAGAEPDAFATFDAVVAQRRAEADAFYAARTSALAPEERAIVRQAYAGLLWSKQFYHYDLLAWLEGDPALPPPPPARKSGRNADWPHLYNRDVLSMPDKWEYPWFAAWDLAFHMLPFANIDPQFAKEQLVLLTREWYMHPSGQLPAYEWAFGDVNPPVHAWAAWRVYKIAVDHHGHRDRIFLARTFQKLLLNFTWWVNRKDADGKNLFSGGFLGLDNIGVFDRSKPLPTGGHLEQADGTAWMAFYSATMLSMALELAKTDPAYEDMASKFFEHFIHIADAMNALGEAGLWDETDGFYYDEIHLADDDKREIPLRVRSMVGLLPLIAVEVLEQSTIAHLPAFKKRMQWFLDNRRDLMSGVAFGTEKHGHVLLALPSRERLVRVLKYMLDEKELLSPFGIRSLSKAHETPYSVELGGQQFSVDYEPGESHTWLFGGNSNWRGPVWMPVNYLLVEALQRYHHFYGDDLKVECPTGSGKWLTLDEVARELSRRLASLFHPDANGARPCHGDNTRYATDPHWRDLVLFHEYFHADTGRGVGASHQTGWTALVIRLIDDLAKGRKR